MPDSIQFYTVIHKPHHRNEHFSQLIVLQTRKVKGRSLRVWMWWFDLMIWKKSCSIQEVGKLLAFKVKLQCDRFTFYESRELVSIQTFRGSWIPPKLDRNSMQHRKPTGFGQQWVKGRPIFGVDLERRLVQKHHVQFKYLDDVVSSEKSEFMFDPTQKIAIVSFDIKTELQWFERPIRIKSEAWAQSCQLQTLRH